MSWCFFMEMTANIEKIQRGKLAFLRLFAKTGYQASKPTIQMSRQVYTSIRYGDAQTISAQAVVSL